MFVCLFVIQEYYKTLKHEIQKAVNLSYSDGKKSKRLKIKCSSYDKNEGQLKNDCNNTTNTLLSPHTCKRKGLCCTNYL